MRPPRPRRLQQGIGRAVRRRSRRRSPRRSRPMARSCVRTTPSRCASASSARTSFSGSSAPSWGAQRAPWVGRNHDQPRLDLPCIEPVGDHALLALPRHRGPQLGGVRVVYGNGGDTFLPEPDVHPGRLEQGIGERLIMLPGGELRAPPRDRPGRPRSAAPTSRRLRARPAPARHLPRAAAPVGLRGQARARMPLPRGRHPPLQRRTVRSLIFPMKLFETSRRRGRVPQIGGK